jgi:hypothetical protein
MRIRTIKPEFWSSFSLSHVSEPALLLAVGLLNHACDRGYFEADPRIIKASIFPLREPSRSIPGALGELSGIGYVAIRQAPDGRLVGHVVNFLRHQRIEKPAKQISKAQVAFESGSPAVEFGAYQPGQSNLFPEPSPTPPGALPEPSGKKPAGTGNREQGAGSNSSEPPEAGAPSSKPSVEAIVLIFPTAGSPANWPLLKDQIEAWQSTFRGVDVSAECKVALEWCKANPTRQKTARGMPRFLFSWLERCQNRCGSSPLNNHANHRPTNPRHFTGQPTYAGITDK